MPMTHMTVKKTQTHTHAHTAYLKIHVSETKGADVTLGIFKSQKGQGEVVLIVLYIKPNIYQIQICTIIDHNLFVATMH